MKLWRLNLVILASLLLVCAVLVVPFLLHNQAAQAAPDGAGLIKRERITVNVGSTLSNTVTSNAVIQGRVVRVDVNYGAGVTTTTDLTLYDDFGVNVVNRANTATDATLYPAVGLTDNTGAALSYDGTRPVVMPYPVAGLLTALITETTAATPAVVLDVYWEQPR
jgi:hypothetical protein